MHRQVAQAGKPAYVPVVFGEPGDVGPQPAPYTRRYQHRRRTPPPQRIRPPDPQPNGPLNRLNNFAGTLPLIQQAIEMAARNYSLAEGAIFHSDRGSNYTSCEFAKALKKHNLRQSVGRTGICYDNAMAESFFAALKKRMRLPHPVSD